MDFYVEVPEEIYYKVMNFDPALGMWFWNMAVMIAPYASGNLRSSITLARNTSKVINIRYSLMMANYAKFLELGQGPVKKHIGFASVKTRLAIVEQLIIYLKTGKIPMFTSTPFVTLRSSSNPFPSEKAFLRRAGMNTHLITANERRKISMIRETNYRKENNLKLTGFRGQRVQTNRTRGRAGSSLLQQFYQETKQS